MHSLPDFVIVLFVTTVVFASLWIGLRLGAAKRRRTIPDKDHLGTIQAAILGLLALVLGFSFSGAMSRFIDRQDSLATEGTAIETAYERAELLATADRIRHSLREYASLRLQLFREDRRQAADELEARMLACYDSARLATYEGVRAAPDYAEVAIPGLESVKEEFSRRSAFDRRHLPAEMILVLIASSCLSVGIIGYGVGLAEQRSTGSAIALTALVAVTLFLTIDFDRPRRGFITLDASPLERAVSRLNLPSAAPPPRGGPTPEAR